MLSCYFARNYCSGKQFDHWFLFFLIFEKKMGFPFKDCFWEKSSVVSASYTNYNEGFFHHLLNCMKKYSPLEAVEGGRLGS